MNLLKYKGFIFDIDGTLIGSNAAHARAWVSALRQHGHPVALSVVSEYIGMGGDKITPRLVGVTEDSSKRDLLYIGDTPFDIEAAARAELDCVAFRSADGRTNI